MLLGYHLLWSTTANVVGTDQQRNEFQQLVIENNYFIGGAVNPRDSDLKVTSEGDEIVFNGTKNFNTGGVVSDITILEGVLEGTTDHIFTAVQTRQPGIQFAVSFAQGSCAPLTTTDPRLAQLEQHRPPTHGIWQRED